MLLSRQRAAVVACALICVLPATAAHAKSHHYHHHGIAHHHHRSTSQSFGDSRPAAWCGWWMRHHLGVADPALNLAVNWARWGVPARGPAPGVIGVMAHHVFQVLDVVGPGKVLAISGNDGHAVRARERSTRSVIAWRM